MVDLGSVPGSSNSLWQSCYEMLPVAASVRVEQYETSGGAAAIGAGETSVLGG